MKINLPDQSSREKDGSIHFHADISAAYLKKEETPFGFRIDLGKEYSVLNEPGTPALPSRVIQVALPANATEITVQAKTSKSRKLFTEPVFIMPVPEYEVAASENGKDFKLSKEEEARLKAGLEFENKETRNIPSPHPRFVPDPEKYNRFLAREYPVAEVSSVVAVGGNCIVHVRINPITFNKDYILELHESIDVIVNYKRSKRSQVSERKIYNSLPQPAPLRESTIRSLKEMVINPKDIVDIDPYPWVEFLQYNYIVITDNYRWDPVTMTPAIEVGDMKAVFERLVSWKRQKGLTARVVTITDIMNNVYGNFKSGAVDLQEVLRNFLKWAHSSWGICWCLLGGDTEIVPIRQAAGECRGTIDELTTDPPADNKCFWTGTFMKIKAVALGEWFSVHDNYLRLTNRNTGRLIPKKAPRSVIVTAGLNANIMLRSFPGNDVFDHSLETTEQFRARLGWYFCTDNTYTTYSATPTNFVRVDGNAAIIHAPLRFHYTWNTIPTDFYYSSLFGPQYNIAGRHDWDFNNNRVYGQREGANSFDPINWNSDICVGRAPASNPSDAAVFVNKVIAYELFRTDDGRFLDRNYIDKMLLVSSDWGGKISFWPTPNDPPEDNRFHTQPAQSRAILQTANDINLGWNRQLISWINDNDVWQIPYNKNATVGIRGWYFAWSPTDLQPAVITFHLLWGITFEFPVITHTIVIYGNASEIAPSRFIFDPVAADGSMVDQEELRRQVDLQLPFVQRFNRLYEDIDSLSPADRLAAPVSRLTSANLDAALNEGQHFVSLSGHGNQNGCCILDSWRASSITNNNKFFIAFADSCLTNAYESNDSMSEALIKNPTGGAIAYLGHTRFSWIGLGDDYERAFFGMLRFTRHLGLLHRSRLNVLLSHPNDDYHKWTVLALNLLGDPEMEVWKMKPFSVVFDIRLIEARLFIKGWNLDDLARPELKDIRVKVYAGENEYTPQMQVDGSFALPAEFSDAEDFRITVSTTGSVPQTFTGEDIRKRTERVQADLAETETREEKPVMETPEFLRDVKPLQPADVQVMEMQTDPQHN